MYKVGFSSKPQIKEVQAQIYSRDYIKAVRCLAISFIYRLKGRVQKKRARGNCSQSKDKIDMFEADENTDAKRNNETTVDSDYGSNNM